MSKTDDDAEYWARIAAGIGPLPGGPPASRAQPVSGAKPVPGAGPAPGTGPGGLPVAGPAPAGYGTPGRGEVLDQAGRPADGTAGGWGPGAPGAAGGWVPGAPGIPGAHSTAHGWETADDGAAARSGYPGGLGFAVPPGAPASGAGLLGLPAGPSVWQQAEAAWRGTGWLHPAHAGQPAGSAAGPVQAAGSAAGPVQPGARRPKPAHWLLLAAMAVVLLAAAAATGVVTIHPGRGAAAAPVRYPPARLAGGVFAAGGGPAGGGIAQTVSRVASAGSTVVGTGSQTGGDIPRAQFFVSRDAGATWALAPVSAPGRGAPPPGHPAELLTHGPRGWLGVGPQAIWTSPDGQSWTLVSSTGIAPADNGDQVRVLTQTPGGYLAAGQNAAEGTAVIWTSPDGTRWRRMTAAQLGLDAGGGPVLNISYAAARGNNVVISGQVAGTVTAGTWLSVDSGLSWHRLTVPARHGASDTLTGLAAGRTGFIAVRPGTAPGAGRRARRHQDAVVYASATGLRWRYTGTLTAKGGAQPQIVTGGPAGFTVIAQETGRREAAYVSRTGTFWRRAAALGSAPATDITGAALTPGRAVIASGSTSRAGRQQPYLAVARPGLPSRVVDVAAISGAVVPEVSVSAVAAFGGRQVAVGGSGGLPAIWSESGGHWSQVRNVPSTGSAGGPGAGSSGAPGPAAGSPAGSRAGSPAGSRTASPAASRTGSPAASRTGSPTASRTGSPAGSRAGSPAGSRTASPTDSPTDSPTASPTDSPAGSRTGSPAASRASSSAASSAAAHPGGPVPGPARTLEQLTSVTHGPAGWLATGAATTGAATPGAAASGTAVTGAGQHPVVLASPDGTAWRDMDGERAFAGTGGAAAQATWGPAGYVIVGSVTTGAGTFPAVWWSAGLRTWTRVAGPAQSGTAQSGTAQSGTAQSGPAQDGPGQMLGVAAGPAGYVAVGQLGVRPAVWTSADGRGWHAASLPAPRGAASAGLRRVAVSGAHVAALGEKQGLNGSQVPFAEVSADGGTTWQQVALPAPHGTATVTAVTGARGGFTAVGTYGSPGNLDVIVWTSADGTQWTAATPHGTGLSGPGVQEITGLDAMAGPGGTTRAASPAPAPSPAPSPAASTSPDASASPIASASPGATASGHGAGGSAAGTGTASRRGSTSGGTVTGVGFTATQDAEQPTLWQFPARSLIPAR